MTSLSKVTGGPFDGKAVLRAIEDRGWPTTSWSIGPYGSCVQMWGEGGDRQAAKTPELVAVGVGGGPVAGSMLLSSR